MEMRALVREQVGGLLGVLAKRVEDAAERGDEPSIHDLRVAVRRLTATLRTFSPLLPAKPVRKVRQRLRRLREVAGAVRDRDIALKLAHKAGEAADGPLCHLLEKQRAKALVRLHRRLRKLAEKGGPERWRIKLDL